MDGRIPFLMALILNMILRLADILVRAIVDLLRILFGFAGQIITAWLGSRSVNHEKEGRRKPLRQSRRRRR